MKPGFQLFCCDQFINNANKYGFLKVIEKCRGNIERVNVHGHIIWSVLEQCEYHTT